MILEKCFFFGFGGGGSKFAYTVSFATICWRLWCIWKMREVATAIDSGLPFEFFIHLLLHSFLVT